MTNLSPGLLKAPEASHYLGICGRTLATLTAAGEVPHIRLGRSLRYPRVELDKWIQACLEKQASGAVA